MFIVTGGAGFIGSNLIKRLNMIDRRDILVVDDLSDSKKINNIKDLEIVDYIEPVEFYSNAKKGILPPSTSSVFHQGACSDTMEENGRYVMENNFTWSKYLLHSCSSNRVPFIYASSASVYGREGPFIENSNKNSPMNLYAYSKTLFDNYVNCTKLSGQIVGLRYFNVYGQNETHKGRMASVVYHFTHQYYEHGCIKLFQGSDGYPDGGQLRDFVHISDVINVNMFFHDRPYLRGIFNVGTGTARSFNDVGLATLNSCRLLDDDEALTLDEAQKMNLVQYIPIPLKLADKYQSFTEASLDKLRSIGYQNSFKSIESGVAEYAGQIYKNLKM